MSSCSEITDSVKKYYGKTLQKSNDLQTTACNRQALCMPKHVQESLKLIHDEVVSKYYGCGLVVPEHLEGMKVLDLGSGSGRDCYALAKLVGESGFVTGIDMTDEQIEVSKKYIEYHRNVFKYQQPNTKFVTGFIENLKEVGIQDDSIDIVVSNCVINLCKDKKRIFEEAYRVLKYGGELYFSDMYTDRQQPKEVRTDEVLWGEGLGGALHWKTLYELANDIGFEVPQLVTCRMIEILKPELKKAVGNAKYASVVFRLFKIPKDAKREISQVVYKGSVTGCEKELKLDQHTTFRKGIPVAVSGSTFAILQNSRFRDDFLFEKPLTSATPHEVMKVNPFEILEKAES